MLRTIKKLIYFILLLAIPDSLRAQSASVDSLYSLLKKDLKEDTTRIKRLTELSAELSGKDLAATIRLADSALNLSQRIGYLKGEIMAMTTLSAAYTAQGYYVQALAKGLAAVALGLFLTK